MRELWLNWVRHSINLRRTKGNQLGLNSVMKWSWHSNCNERSLDEMNFGMYWYETVTWIGVVTWSDLSKGNCNKSSMRLEWNVKRSYIRICCTTREVYSWNSCPAKCHIYDISNVNISFNGLKEHYFPILLESIL